MLKNRVEYVHEEIDEVFGSFFVDFVERDALTLTLSHKTKEFVSLDSATRFHRALNEDIKRRVHAHATA